MSVENLFVQIPHLLYSSSSSTNMVTPSSTGAEDVGELRLSCCVVGRRAENFSSDSLQQLELRCITALRVSLCSTKLLKRLG